MSKSAVKSGGKRLSLLIMWVNIVKRAGNPSSVIPRHVEFQFLNRSSTVTCRARRPIRWEERRCRQIGYIAPPSTCLVDELRPVRRTSHLRSKKWRYWQGLYINLVDISSIRFGHEHGTNER